MSNPEIERDLKTLEIVLAGLESSKGPTSKGMRKLIKDLKAKIENTKKLIR